MGTGVVAAIIAAIVLIAAGVTAAVVLSHDQKDVAPPDISVEIKQPAQKTAAAFAPRLPSDSVIRLASNESVLALGQVVDLGFGVTLTPADGWTVAEQQEGYVQVHNDDADVLFMVVAGRTEPADIERILDHDIDTVAENFGLSHIKTSDVDVTQIQGSRNFEQIALMRFQADMGTQQGSLPVYGLFGELYNSETNVSAFTFLAGSDEDAVRASAEGADVMLNSMM